MPFIMSDLETLDPAALKAMICVQHAELVSHRSQIERLELLIAKLRRMQFGQSSEKVERQIEQLELKLEELEASQTELAPEPTSQASNKDRSSTPQEETSSPRTSSSRSS
jgi:phage shock protein A